MVPGDIIIPWDDDVDIEMKRPDYDKLLTLSQKQDFLPPYLKIITYEYGTSQYPFMKIIDTRYNMKQEYIKKGAVTSVWIDIFPTDGLPDSQEKITKIYKRLAFIEKFSC